MVERDEAFANIARVLRGSIRLQNTDTLVAEGDSLELLRLLPDDSVSLILTDPPYHSTKKNNIYGDTHFEEDEHFIEWMRELDDLVALVFSLVAAPKRRPDGGTLSPRGRCPCSFGAAAEG